MSNLRKQLVGIAAIGAKTEAGWERSDNLTATLSKNLAANDIYCVCASRSIFNSADALAVAEEMNSKNVSLLILIHSTWVMDNLQYILYNQMNCPIVMAAVPYIETFSMASVQHFSSLLKRRGHFSNYLSADLDSSAAVAHIQQVLSAIRATDTVQNAIIGSIGPRQTWRTAGAQDMTSDEWALTEALGATIVHIEPEEWFDCLAAHSDDEAVAVQKDFCSRANIDMRTAEEQFLKCAKFYLAIKDLIKKYHLTCATAQCYPVNGGISNLAACMLADEGFVLDTEGDISHALIMSALNAMDGKPCVLSEPGTYDYQEHVFYLTHEGSSCLSACESGTEAVVQECGDGVMIGFMHKPLSAATLVNFSGEPGGKYLLSVLNGHIQKSNPIRFDETGNRLLIAFTNDSDTVYHDLISAGADHHLLAKADDLSETIRLFCQLTGISYHHCANSQIF